MKSELMPVGDIARSLPRSGQWIPGPERKPEHPISQRSKDVWKKLGTWYGAGKLDDFGEWPPVELCKLIDAVRTRDELGAVLADVKQAHPMWPPTIPQFEAIFRRHAPPPVDWRKLREDLRAYVIRTRYDTMSTSQRIGIPRWTWNSAGVEIPAGDGAAGFFVPFSDLPA